ncbi:MAG: putative replicase [Cressdnaviricota sp.]|nr:MAG: putative replicase [Cressdnaviricota sp.]
MLIETKKVQSTKIIKNMSKSMEEQKMKSVAFTISPKMNEFEHLLPDLKKVLDRQGEWCLVVETSDTGHVHLHGGVIGKRPVAAVGQAIKNYWKVVDPDYGHKTYLGKTWYKPVENSIDDGRMKTWMKYLFKTEVPVHYSDNFPKDDDLNDCLAENIPSDKRRASVCWKQLRLLDKLVDDHGLEQPMTVEECAIAINTLSFKLKVFERPLNAVKFRELVTGWWMFRIDYNGDGGGTYKLKDMPWWGTDREMCEREFDEITRYKKRKIC